MKYALSEARPGVTIIGAELFPQAATMAEDDKRANAQLAAQARPGTRPVHHTSDGA